MTFILPYENPKILPPGQYKTDFFNKNPLFYVTNKKTGEYSFVSQLNEAYALHGNPDLDDINDAFLASLIDYSPNSRCSPYKKITKLPRGTFLSIKNNKEFKTYDYDPFNVSLTVNNKDDLYEFVKFRLMNIMKTNIDVEKDNIAFELSSGIDSNSILGCALKSIKLEPNQVFISSYEGYGELKFLDESIKFHNLKKENIHVTKKHNIYKEKKNSLDRNLSSLGAPSQIGDFPMDLFFLRNKSCNKLFSGLGGDQAISHHGRNARKDLVCDMRISKLIKWSKGINPALKIFIQYLFLTEQFNKYKLRKRSERWIDSSILKNFLTDIGHSKFDHYFKEKDFSELNSNLRMRDSIKKRISSELIAVRVDEEIRYAKAYGMQKIFPLLDELTIGTLINQDPLFFCEDIQNTRQVARESFKDFIPERLYKNASKKLYISQEWEKEWQELVFNYLSENISIDFSWHHLISNYWKIDDLIENILKNLNQKTSIKKLLGFKIAYETLTSIDHWFKKID